MTNIRYGKGWKFLPSPTAEVPLMVEILNLGASNPINAFSHFQIQMPVVMRMVVWFCIT